MRVLVTGHQGFMGRNLVECLRRTKDVEVDGFGREDDLSELAEKLEHADFVFHLAGVNRPDNIEAFYEGNAALTQYIIEILNKKNKRTPIVMSSSTQVCQGNDYGKSKRIGEEALIAYAKTSGASVWIYRLPNVFGKWSRPSYNSVIATWCYNIARDIPIRVDDENIQLRLVYIDDVVNHFVSHLNTFTHSQKFFYEVSPVYRKTLGEIRDLLQSFKDSRESLVVPRVGKGFERALYATYLSFLPSNAFSYTLKGREDARGSFYEFLKTIDSGQFSVSTTAPGVTRGGHYHNTKNEKFLIVKGEATILHRQIDGDDVIEYKVSDKKMEVVEMIPGYTHDITNTGDCELILLLWANECYDPKQPDTYPCPL